MDPAAQPAAPLAPAGLKPWCIVLLASNDALAVWFICGANWKPQSDAELGTEPSGFSAMAPLRSMPAVAGRRSDLRRRRLADGGTSCCASGAASRKTAFYWWREESHST